MAESAPEEEAKKLREAAHSHDAKAYVIQVIGTAEALETLLGNTEVAAVIVDERDSNPQETLEESVRY